MLNQIASRASAPITVLHASFVEASTRLSASTLACLHYGVALPDDDPRRMQVPLAELLGDGRVECWGAGRPVLEAGRDNGLAYAHDGEHLFAHVTLPASDAVRATEDAYWRLEALLARHDFPHWLRTWNFLGGINDGDGDAERYRQFSVGRARALASRPDFERHLPAATAIGSPGSELVVALIASRSPGQPVENPRQVAAYRYPKLYGPRSPSFTRAMLVRNGDEVRLLVSGTASVVGHATRHAGDALAQLQETRANLDALLRHAAVSHFPNVGEPMWTPESFKLYVRNAEDLPHLTTAFPLQFGRQAPWLMLLGDVCRHDLLLEVEGTYRWHGPV